jgi:hypothetical protein
MPRITPLNPEGNDPLAGSTMTAFRVELEPYFATGARRS